MLTFWKCEAKILLSRSSSLKSKILFLSKKIFADCIQAGEGLKFTLFDDLCLIHHKYAGKFNIVVIRWGPHPRIDQTEN